uniref:FAD-binding PCMH-type domain-containing protein n=1 Tax=Amphimedon queenslandica TaxID=400682 RepID=A0A1X7VB45_AMPQE
MLTVKIAKVELLQNKVLYGNLCKCTGYRPILDGFRSFCKDCSCSEKQEELKNYGNKRFIIEPSQEVIFPPELKLQHSAMTSLLIQGSRTKWYRPITLNELLTIREQFPANSDNMIVAGNVGIDCDKLAKPSILIAVSCVNELQVLEINEKGLLVGAAVTIGRLEEKLMKIMESLPGGNIVNGTPDSDLIPVLQTDILIDVGDSLNPAIDIGQIEDAFIQGLAIGEPPLFLASSVFFAIRDTVKSAREEKGVAGYFEFLVQPQLRE